MLGAGVSVDEGQEQLRGGDRPVPAEKASEHRLEWLRQRHRIDGRGPRGRRAGNAIGQARKGALNPGGVVQGRDEEIHGERLAVGDGTLRQIHALLAVGVERQRHVRCTILSAMAAAA